MQIRFKESDVRVHTEQLCFLTGKIAKLDCLRLSVLTAGMMWLFNNRMNTCIKHITQIKLFNQICCLEKAVLNTVVNTTRQQSCSATERTTLHGGNFKPFFKVWGSTPFSYARYCQEQEMLHFLFLNNRYLFLPTLVFEILGVAEVSTFYISTFLHNHSQLRELDFKLLKIYF